MSDSKRVASPRLRSLDGLRGVAAVAVLGCHLLLANPDLADDPGPGKFTVSWWFTATPLKIFTVGNEAVIVFFLLSGFVLTLPVLLSASFNWRSYFIARSLRLWIPVATSLFLAALWISLAHQDPTRASSEWVKASSTPELGLGALVRSLDGIKGPIHLNNPLWSLQWEFIFSYFLPVFVGLAVLINRWLPAVMAACWALIFIGERWDAPYLRYLPVFLAGAVFAANLPRLSRWGRRITAAKNGNLGWVALLVTGSLLLTGYGVAHEASLRNQLVLAALQGFVFVGAALIVFVGAFSPWAVGFLESRPIQWLGKISFSLYLVHVPIILFISFAVGANGWGVIVLLALPAALGTAQLFYWIVEGPAHKFSRFAGEQVADKLDGFTGESFRRSAALALIPPRSARDQ